MKKKSRDVEQPVRSSWEIWEFLIAHAGMDTLFYDREFLNGSPSFNGLSQHLGFRLQKEKVAVQLQKHKITVEQFIGAFFNVLQPYASMMNDLCGCFARHGVTGTGRSLKIVFDFGKADKKLDFDLENFRSVLATYSTIRKKLSYYRVSNVWGLLNIFPHSDVIDPDLKGKYDKKALRWLKGYSQGIYLEPDVDLPLTGHASLDFQLSRVLEFWRTYVNELRGRGPYVDQVKLTFFQARHDTSDGNKERLMEDFALQAWDLDPRIFDAESDRWSVTMLERILITVNKLREMDELQEYELAEDYKKRLANFFSGLPQSEKETASVIRELADLLNLPVWKHRYELFSSWIFSSLDRVFDLYDRKIHHHDGLLTFTFKATHLMTIQSEEGPFELWAENRTLAIKPNGHGRKKGIQPDYTIYKPSAGDPKDCVACIEVKQYRKAGLANFINAINDYGHGLPNATIFLVNYGPMPSSLLLDFPKRSFYYGDVRPASYALSRFEEQLRYRLPVQKLKTPEEKQRHRLKKMIIENLYIDISSSMDNQDIRKYMAFFVGAMMLYRKAKRLIAVDDRFRDLTDEHPNYQPSPLLKMQFTESNDFEMLFNGNTDANCVIVTDPHGAEQISNTTFKPVIVVVHGKTASLWACPEGGATYCLYAEESLMLSPRGYSPGFSGWLYEVGQPAFAW